MACKPKLTDYLGWKLRAKWHIAQAILAAYWNGVWFCQRMGWARVQDFYWRTVIGRGPLAWADRIVITVHMQVWVNEARRRMRRKR